MYMQSIVNFCDATQKTYPSPQKGAVLLKDDGDGCWQVASNVGPEYIERNGIKPLSKEKCRMEIESRGGVLAS